ncbi:hypothetical protein [Streptomyces rimosus]|uniref:hypothetical protein n=1 Tax=Streptomyces rimosus TaxID=1927 RepID=UPI001F17ACDB|nr:hypothetical protein [Streptomyces rimosus]
MKDSQVRVVWVVVALGGPAVEQRLPGYPEPAVEGGVEQPLVGARPFPVQMQSVVAGDQGG